MKVVPTKAQATCIARSFLYDRPSPAHDGSGKFTSNPQPLNPEQHKVCRSSVAGWPSPGYSLFYVAHMLPDTIYSAAGHNHIKHLPPVEIDSQISSDPPTYNAKTFICYS